MNDAFVLIHPIRSAGDAIALITTRQWSGDQPIWSEDQVTRLVTEVAPSATRWFGGQQVHGNQVTVIDREFLESSDSTPLISHADGLVTNIPNVALIIRVADCAPVYFYDPQKQVVGLAHVGWKGLVAGIIPRMVEVFTTGFGSQPSEIVASVGPSLALDHFEVKSDLMSAVAKNISSPSTDLFQQRGESHFFDFQFAITTELKKLGLRDVTYSALCTYCRKDLFHSYRRDGQGMQGRNLALMMLSV